MEQYPYQIEVNRAVWRHFRDGVQSVLVVAPPGSGKTVIGAFQAMQRHIHLQEKTLLSAHRREIVFQGARKMEAAGMRPGIVMAGQVPDSWANVWVGSLATMHSRKDIPECDVLWIDETHRDVRGKRYRKIIADHLARGGKLLGTTATPIDSEGNGLGDIYQVMVRTPDVPWMIEHGYLTPPRYCVGMAPDKKFVVENHTQQQIDDVVNGKILVGSIVDNWIHWASDRKTLIFAAGVKHSMNLAAQFNAIGVKAVHVDGETPAEVRDEIYQRSESGDIQVICNAQVYVEGTDFPWIDCVVDGQPTKSLTRYLQKNLRGGRAYPGKADFLVMDHANNVWRHGRLELPRDWELSIGKGQEERLAAKRKETEKAQIKCHVCGFLLTRTVCSNCGASFVPQGKEAKYLPGMLIELTEAEHEKLQITGVRQYTREEKQEWLSGLIQLCRTTKANKPDRLAAHLFRQRFKEWPNGLRQEPRQPPFELQLWWDKDRQNYMRRKSYGERRAKSQEKARASA